MKNAYNVLIDFTMLKALYSGFGQFSLYLGKALQEAVQQENYNALNLTYLLPKNFDASVFSKVTIIRENSLKKHSSIFVKNLLFQKYDLIHLTTQNSRYTLSNKALIYTIHDLNFLIDEDPTFAKKKLRAMQSTIDLASYVSTISKSTEKDVREYFDFNIHTKVIYNGASLHTGILAKKPVFVKNTLPFLFTIGAIYKKKNFHVLIDLLRLLPNYQLFIAGKKASDYVDFIQDSINKLGLNSRIKLLGQISENDKNWLYQNCEAFVFPSKLEGFGLPIIEAMSLGKPVFLSKSSCLPEIGGREAYYFESFEPESMKKVFVEGMQDYKNDLGKKERIINHAKQFTWEKAANEYLDLYKEVLTN